MVLGRSDIWAFVCQCLIERGESSGYPYDCFCEADEDQWTQENVVQFLQADTSLEEISNDDIEEERREMSEIEGEQEKRLKGFS
jgi:hypothetical protein